MDRLSQLALSIWLGDGGDPQRNMILQTLGVLRLIFPIIREALGCFFHSIASL